MIARAMLLAAVASLHLSAAATAADWSGCYARAYDARHLAAHRGQNVVRITLKLEPHNADGMIANADFDFRLRGEKRRRYAVGGCRAKGDALYCPLDSDAGAVTVSRAERGMRVEVDGELRISPPEDETDIKTISDAEDRVFLLPSAANSVCK